MTSKINWIRIGLYAASLASSFGAVSLSHAATYDLVAAPFDKTMPDGSSVPMWGFALDGPTLQPSAPGPQLVVPPGDTTLTVNLRNTLPEPVSIVIPGQPAVMTPVMFTDGQGRQRVRSFTAEAVPASIQTYTWSNLKPGTYLYHSGTHPQIQVQMGLYGAVKHDAASGSAYPNIAYDSEATLLYSEIDPVLHRAVAAGRYGQPVPALLPAGLTAADFPSSTIDYAPKYFLVNGNAWAAGSAPIPAGSVGGRTLVRFLNAGLRTQMPLLQGQYLSLVAEDGSPYPYAKEQYSVTLLALKTVDAILSPTATGTFPVYNRRLDPGSTAYAAGGMLTYLQVGAGAPGAPVAAADTYATNEDIPLSVPLPGVLGNDTGTALTAALVSGTSHGGLVLNADGSFTYNPNLNFFGSDSFTYQAVQGIQSNAATVAITVNPVNDAPVAGADGPYTGTVGTTLNVAAPGVLGNDTDVDGGVLTAQLVPASLVPVGLTLNPNGSFSFFNATEGTYSFSYQAIDNAGALSNAVPVQITLNPALNHPPVAVNDTVSTKMNISLAINVLANDSDPDGNLLPSSVQLPNGATTVTTKKGGTFTVNTLTGVVTYAPRLNYRGSDSVTYTVKDTLGATSNRATINVNVVR